ncbi:Tom22-domain-containing protein [Daldinia caldariorum]|uniref:Tom22-domain-containing protein n=1 Tax=Daldinia caldariorum TaxID=326644 RepID=UPI002007ACEB|nr:Tom22-domain-containing protein [Daldinia caldariorum]KAI1469381.1 Tom22-domain-containing protein [Daldinia caldariorum]
MNSLSNFEDFPPSPPIPPTPPNSPVTPAQDQHTELDLRLLFFHGNGNGNGNNVDIIPMVQLTEVIDEHFQEGQLGPDEDEDFTDTDSEISTESDYDPSSETLAERLYALRDIIPPHTRTSIANKVNATTSAVSSFFSFSGKSLWVISTSALILGVPWALAWAEEQQVMEMEKEMKMREMGGEILTAGASGPNSSTAQQVGAALDREAKPAL